MSTITHILYDLGNTLLYFDGDWDEVFDRAIRASAMNLPEAGIDRVNPERFCAAFAEAFRAYYVQREVDHVELTAEHVLRQTLAALDAPLPGEAAIRTVLGAFYGVTQAHWKPVGGVRDVLSGLKAQGIHQGILSNASHDADVQTLVDRANLRRYMDFVLSSAKIGLRKPHAGAFREALTRWGAPPENILMVGDTLQADILGANQVGIRSAWVQRFANPQENILIQPDAELEDLAELMVLVAGPG